MVAEFNPNRGFNKRTREPVKSINQKFDDAKFNFNKIADSEILFKLDPDSNMMARVRIYIFDFNNTYVYHGIPNERKFHY